jgi:hypothetical protein
VGLRGRAECARVGAGGAGLLKRSREGKGGHARSRQKKEAKKGRCHAGALQDTASVLGEPGRAREEEVLATALEGKSQ